MCVCIYIYYTNGLFVNVAVLSFGNVFLNCSPSECQLSSSVGSAPHSFPNFQHPSHELLRENGFVWQVYNKYHARCLKGIRTASLFHYVLLYGDQRWLCTLSDTTEGLSVPHLMCWRTEGTFTTARRCCDIFVILAPDTKPQTYLLR